jgi:hypothetical protein
MKALEINPSKKLEKLTKLEQRAYKINDAYNYKLEYILPILFEKPENEWFKADNKFFTHTYDVCVELYEMNLICKKVKPIFKNGSFCGNNVYFKYNKNLQY